MKKIFLKLLLYLVILLFVIIIIGINNKVFGKGLSIVSSTRTIHIETEINMIIAKRVFNKLKKLNKTNGDIRIYITSCGGNIMAGLLIIDGMNLSKNDIQTICLGNASSMASFILAYGARGKRRILKNSGSYLHEIQISFGYGYQSISEIEKSNKFTIYLQNKLIKILSKDIGKSKKETLEILKKDKWFTSWELMELNFVDDFYKFDEVK